MNNIREAGFNSIGIAQEAPYNETDGRKITSLVIKAVK